MNNRSRHSRLSNLRPFWKRLNSVDVYRRIISLPSSSFVQHRSLFKHKDAISYYVRGDRMTTVNRLNTSEAAFI